MIYPDRFLLFSHLRKDQFHFSGDPSIMPVPSTFRMLNRDDHPFLNIPRGLKFDTATDVISDVRL